MVIETKKKKKYAVDNEQSEFFELFNGAEEISGVGKTYEAAFEELKSRGDDIWKVATACLIFAEKPTKYLLEGKTSANPNDPSKIVKAEIASYLPKHLGEMKGKDEKETQEIKEKRSKWPEDFQRVNFTQVRNIAYICLQAQSKQERFYISSPYEQWVGKYGGGPVSLLINIDKYFPEENDTKKIRSAQLQKFSNERRFWEEKVNELSSLIQKSCDKKME